MKKIISIVLVAMMIMACLPLSVFAATNVAKIGNTEYATLDAAIAEVKSGETIVLLSDANISSTGSGAKTYTIDGSNRKYAVNLTPTGHLYTGENSVTFKGVKFQMGSKQIDNAAGTKGDFIFDNCYITGTRGMRHCGKGNYSLINGTLYEGSMEETMFYLRGDNGDATENEAVITVDNSTVVQTVGKATQLMNQAIFHSNSRGAAYKFNITNNSVIKQASTVSNADGACIFYFQKSDTNGYATSSTITTDSTVKFIIASSSKSLSTVEFMRTDYSTGENNKVQVNTLIGIPQFIVSENVATQGVKMPNLTKITSADGSITYANKWSTGTSVVAGGTSVVGTGEMRIAPVIESASFGNKAALITSGNGTAPATYDSLDDAVNAVKDGQTIVLLKDATQSVADKEGITYTIDGCGGAYTIQTQSNGTGTDKAGFHIGNGNIIYKGVKFNIASGNNFLFDKNKTGDVVFDSCHIVSANGMSHRGKGNVSFINGTLYEGSSMGSTMFYMRGDNVTGENEAVITVEDSTIIQQCGGPVSETQNAGIFHCNPRGGATYTFNIKGNAVLKQESAKANMQGACIFYFQLSDYNGYAGNTVINADSTAKLILASKSTALKEVTFIRTDYTRGSNGKIQENILNGTPQFIASDNVVKQGVTMPNVIHNSADGKIRYTNVWSIDGGATSFKGNADALKANVYKNANATTDTVFTPVDTKYTAANAPIPFGVEKAGKVEYYETWNEIYYRRNLDDAYVLGRNYDYSVGNIFSGQLNKDPYGTKTVTTNGTTTTEFLYDETWTLKGADTGTNAKINLVAKSNYTSGMATWQYYDFVGARNITIENLNITFEDNIDTDPATTSGVLTFNDCIVNLNAAVRFTNNCKMTFNNCKVLSSVADCLFFIRNENANDEALITVNNTDIIKSGPQAHINNANIFHVVNYVNDPCYNVRIVIKGKSRIENCGTGITNLHIIHFQSNERATDKCVLEIHGNDVVFALNPMGESLTGGMFIKVGKDRILDMIGMPKFEMNALAANSGVAFFGGDSGRYNRAGAENSSERSLLRRMGKSSLFPMRSRQVR